MKLNNIMKQAQKMQAQMMQIQEKLAEETVEASVGGGMVKAVFTGGLKQSKELAAQRMGSVTGALGAMGLGM